ncbi:MAG: valine--tRNA ligase [Candidatus Riflebacteria bacterium]|nr:valine--tRNA ligase [Candidatus Riflebacteria bacterium]
MNTQNDLNSNPIPAADAPLDKAYNPKLVEERVYQSWETSGAFHASEKSSKKPYTIVIPPPNVTGMLTMGHVLNNTLQDILIRFHRMLGHETLWLPGTDHAGIATQNVVEKSLAKDKVSRHDLGRENFVQKVWEWKEKYGGIIIKQLKRLGCSCDWERERFTMDSGLSEAVQQSFIKLYEKGLIYKGKYIINWCPRCRTALSDEEKIPQDTQGHLWYIKYPLKNGNGHLTVATTRPETMLGDTAVAVNPDDDRFRELIGKMVVLPLVNREIPVIADDFVDPKFGTGAVKVTPAHDPNDFEMGRRNSLPSIIVMDEGGKMNEAAGTYSGMDRFKCREKVIEDLQELGLLEKIEDHALAVGHCERCQTVIEPYLSDQWFVKMRPLAQPAIAAVKNGKLRFTPERWIGVYLHWMENIRDWCISRQLWWGHRIPAYTCEKCKNVMVAAKMPEKCCKCGDTTSIKQDEDVLDTWFSSWLWPFSTMGWPEDTETLRKFYPTDSLVTGPDIIFFWVARMVMAGYEFLGECPFHDVYFTSIVRDIKGRKMSKSLGNSPDPLEIIDKFGADALRFTVVFLAPVGQDIRFAADKVEMGRNFANKLWNASRFVLMNLGDNFRRESCDESSLSTWDRWIISRLNKTIEQTTAHLQDGQYRFNDAMKAVYDFVWDEFCDWYIEMTKPLLFGDDCPQKRAALQTLVKIIDSALRLLHPFMPFVTDEIWRKIPGNTGMLINSEFPTVTPSAVNLPLESEVSDVREAVRVIRNLRSSANVQPAKKVTIRVLEAGSHINLIKQHEGMLKHLAGVECIEFVSSKPPKHLVGLFGDTELCLSLEGVIDVPVEITRITNEKSKIEKEIEKLSAKLKDDKFVQKAPAEVVENLREGFNAYQVQVGKLSEYLDELRKL